MTQLSVYKLNRTLSAAGFVHSRPIQNEDGSVTVRIELRSQYLKRRKKMTKQEKYEECLEDYTQEFADSLYRNDIADGHVKKKS